MTSYFRTRHYVSDFLSKNKFNVIGIGGLITTYGYVKWVTGIIRRNSNKTHIVVGGGVVSWDPKYTLNALNADITIMGEGEEPFPEVVKNIDSIKDKGPRIPGVTYQDSSGKIVSNPPKIIDNLDSIPLPDWDKFPMEDYVKNAIDIPRNLKRGLDVFTGRGCPMSCSFCYKLFGKGARFRTIDNYLYEARIIKEKFNLDHLIFGDELFTISKRRVLEFCNKYIESGINLPLRMWGRLDTIDEESVEALKNAGCISYNVGIESGSPKILKNMNKNITLDKMERGIELIRNSGIDLISSYIHGMTGENEETVNESIKFYKRMRLKPIPFFINPYPGSPLWTKEVNDKIILKYKTIDNYLKTLGDATLFVINISEVSDRKLIELHKKIIYETLGMNRYIYFFYMWYLRLKIIRKKGLIWSINSLSRKLSGKKEEFQK